MSKVRKRVTCGLMGIIMALVCVIGHMPTVTAYAATSIDGGHTTRADAYAWGSYTDNKSISVTLPAEEDDVWISFSLSGGEKIYARCSYSSNDEGMYIEMRNSSNTLLDAEYSPDDVHDLDTIIPFLAVNCDNGTSSSQTYYIHVNRGTAVGSLYFSITLRDRIKNGRGTFNFSGTASNPGNSSMSLSGVDSSILSLNLTNNTSIPPEAIVTRVSTSGTQSPSQGNVHHMIWPASQSPIWYTSTVSSASSGSYTINETDDFQAKQVWQFKYNALATAKSTMKNVKLTIEWIYDIANTDYETYQ